MTRNKKENIHSSKKEKEEEEEEEEKIPQVAHLMNNDSISTRI